VGVAVKEATLLKSAEKNKCVPNEWDVPGDKKTECVLHVWMMGGGSGIGHWLTHS